MRTLLRDVTAYVFLVAVLAVIITVILFMMSGGVGMITDLPTLMIIFALALILSVMLASTKNQQDENARLAAELPRPLAFTR